VLNISAWMYARKAFRSQSCCRKASHGMRHRDQGEYHPAVYSRIVRRFADLHVTFEEGTWAAWLYNLLKPHVTEVVVCNPRKNALLKDGSKSERIDARKLAEQLYMNKIKSVYHGEHGLRPLKEGTSAQLSDHHQGSHAGHESAQGVVSQLGHSVCRQRSVCTTPPFGMAQQDHRSRRPATR
jgi:hypothetical protein